MPARTPCADRITCDTPSAPVYTVRFRRKARSSPDDRPPPGHHVTAGETRRREEGDDK